jgi:ADP-heptose:LPS heptosyltransferase
MTTIDATEARERASVLAALRGRRARIALLRATPGLGDLLCCGPSWRALRRAVPDARIVLIAPRRLEPVVRRMDGAIDEVLPFPGFPGLPDASADVRSAGSFVRRCQRRAFDLIVQQHGSGVVSNPLACLLGGRATGGFYEPGHFMPDPDLFMPYPGEVHEIHRHLRLMAHLGAPPAGDDLRFAIADTDIRGLDQALPERPRDAYAVLHPGADDPSRRWPADRFAAVGDALSDHGLDVVITGDGQERGLACSVAAAMRRSALVAARRTDLLSLGALLAGAAVVVANDTGAAHLAMATHAPTVVVGLRSDFPRWAPLDTVRHAAVFAGGAAPSVGEVVAAAGRVAR